MDASQHLATKLASNHRYYEVCAHYLTQELPSSHATQTRIFSSQWMTWTFFKSFILKYYGSRNGTHKRDGVRSFVQWPPDFENATGIIWSRSNISPLSVVKCYIPARLLHGPWAPEKLQFLGFLLNTTNMSANWSDPHIHQLLIKGQKDAIKQKNLEAVQLFTQDRRLAKPPDLKLVRFAVIEADCDRSIVFDILCMARAYSRRRETWKCPELDDWCENGVRNGDRKAKWLLEKLQELRSKDKWVGTLYGENLDPKLGDYDGGEGDRLLVNRSYPRDRSMTPLEFGRYRKGVHVGDLVDGGR